MLKIAPALFTFLSLAAADDGAAVLGVAAGARNGVVAGTNLGGVAIGALNDLEGLDRDLGREAAAIDFRAGKPLDGNLYGNGVKFYVKGVNWYGSEGRVDGPGPPGGLDVHSISWYMACGKKGTAAEVTSGLLSAEAERRMEENGGLQAAGLIRGVGQGMDGGADVHEEWD